MKEIEESIARCAVDAHRQGSLLIAIAPDLTTDKAAALLSEVISRNGQLLGGPKMPKFHPRSRFEDWFPSITIFEDECTGKHGVTSSVFTAYRRIVNGIDFGSEANSPR